MSWIVSQSIIQSAVTSTSISIPRFPAKSACWPAEAASRAPLSLLVGNGSSRRASSPCAKRKAIPQGGDVMVSRYKEGVFLLSYLVAFLSTRVGSCRTTPGDATPWSVQTSTFMLGPWLPESAEEVVQRSHDGLGTVSDNWRLIRNPCRYMEG